MSVGSTSMSVAVRLAQVARLRYGIALALSCLIAGCGSQQETTVPPGSVKTTLPTRCSSKTPSHIPANSWPAPQHQLAPPGADAIRLCRYSGLNSHPRLTLVRSALVIHGQLVSELVREFNALPAQKAPIACPAGDASEIAALLAYPTGRTVTITTELQGCQAVTNGDINRIALQIGTDKMVGPHLVSQLRQLTDA